MAKEDYPFTFTKWQCTTLTDVSSLITEVYGENRTWSWIASY